MIKFLFSSFFYFQFVAFLLLTSIGISQPTVQWNKQINNLGMTYAADQKLLQIRHDGSVEILGTGNFFQPDEFLTLHCFSSNGDSLWQVSFDTSFAVAMAIGSDDATYAAGYTADSGKNFVVKYDAQGNFQWSTLFDVGRPIDIVTDTDDNLYVCGWYTSGGIPYVTKYSKDGDQLWFHTLSLSAPYLGNMVYQSGKIMGTFSFDATSMLSYSFSDGGTLNWSTTYSASTPVECFDVTVDPSFNLYTTGYFHSAYADNDMLLRKLDSTGAVDFNSTWGTNQMSSYEEGRSMLWSNDSIYVVGQLDSANTEFISCVVFDATGNVIRTIKTQVEGYGKRIRMDDAGNFYWGGWKTTPNGYHFYVEKRDHNLDSIWHYEYGLMNWDNMFVDFKLQGDSVVYITGYSVLGYDNDGILIKLVNPAFSCHADFVLVADTSQPGFYWGYNQSSGANLNYTWSWGDGSSSTGQFPTHVYADSGLYDICLMVHDTLSNCTDTFCTNYQILKAAGMMNIHEIMVVDNPLVVPLISADNPIEWYLSPNPFSSSSTIKISLGRESDLKISLLDLQGREIKTIAEGNFESGDHKFLLQKENLSEGIYFLQLKSETGIAIRKLIIQ